MAKPRHQRDFPLETLQPRSRRVRIEVEHFERDKADRRLLHGAVDGALPAAIKRVWDQKEKSATITDVYDLLRTGRLSDEGEVERDLSRLATALEPYTKYGIYASYFEGEANIQFRKNLVVLELEELKAKKDLQAVVMQVMMYRITQEMYLVRSKRKLVIIDEAWDLMGSGSSANFIEAGYRRARKYGGLRAT